MELAIVTPTFRGDLGRCELLCESIDRWVDPKFTHHLLVDRRDLPLFEYLESPRRRIWTAESMLPLWLHRVPIFTRWRVTPSTLPVRNWILQQIVKLSVGNHIPSENYMIVDSDVAFIRPLDPDRFLRGDRLRLFREPAERQNGMHLRWHRAAAKLLGLPRQGYLDSHYVGNLITWRRDVLLMLHEHLSRIAGGSWQRALCNTLHFSEYILYGAFVDNVLGDQTLHFREDQPLCHSLWTDELAPSAKEVREFVKKAGSDVIAVHIQSAIGHEVETYSDAIRELWSKVDDRSISGPDSTRPRTTWPAQNPSNCS
ncbi:MAG: hypothetical protein JJU22_13840 [Gammaproteobacteria bacterium]|nr:hypothetical protein [Gammaproteobacteria bacterium]